MAQREDTIEMAYASTMAMVAGGNTPSIALNNGLAYGRILKDSSTTSLLREAVELAQKLLRAKNEGVDTEMAVVREAREFCVRAQSQPREYRRSRTNQRIQQQQVSFTLMFNARVGAWTICAQLRRKWGVHGESDPVSTPGTAARGGKGKGGAEPTRKVTKTGPLTVRAFFPSAANKTAETSTAQSAPPEATPLSPQTQASQSSMPDLSQVPQTDQDYLDAEDVAMGTEDDEFDISLPEECFSTQEATQGADAKDGTWTADEDDKRAAGPSNAGREQSSSSSGSTHPAGRRRRRPRRRANTPRARRARQKRQRSSSPDARKQQKVDGE